MTLNFELVRGNDRLECDWFVWWDTTELARAFGWRPRSLNPTRPSLSKLMDVSNPPEVSNEDAQSLATAIADCLRILITNKRPTRRQMASLLPFTDANSIGAFLEQPARIGAFLKEPVRIAKFCVNGAFRMNLKRQTAAGLRSED